MADAEDGLGEAEEIQEEAMGDFIHGFHVEGKKKEVNLLMDQFHSAIGPKIDYGRKGMEKVSHVEQLRRHVEDLCVHATELFHEGGESQLEEAEEALRHALVLSPVHVDSIMRLGTVLEALGHSAAAEETLRTALGLDPDHRDTLCNLAVLYAEREEDPDFGQAEALLRRALALDNKDVDVLFNLGSLLKTIGLIDEAEVMYRRAQYICNNDYNKMNAGWCTEYFVYQAHAHDTGAEVADEEVDELADINEEETYLNHDNTLQADANEFVEHKNARDSMRVSMAREASEAHGDDAVDDGVAYDAQNPDPLDVVPLSHGGHLDRSSAVRHI